MMATKNKEIDQVVPRLRMILESLSKKEREIINELLLAGHEIKEITIYELAESHGISPAYIVKLARKCGFSGYRELKSEVFKYFSSTNILQQELLDPNDSAKEVANKIFRTAISNLQETLAVLNYQSLSEAYEILHKAKNIFFIGVGGSGSLAMDAHHKFLRIGKHPQWSNDPYIMLMKIQTMGANDVLVAFTHSGQTKAIIDCIEEAKKHKIKTIVITNSPKSKACESADVNLYSVAFSTPITGEGVAARIVQLCILDTLFILVAQDFYSDSLENINNIYSTLQKKELRL